MIVVIQCAARKWPDAGRMIAADGRPVEFVAEPKIAPFDDSRVYARPDDYADGDKPWRQRLVEYNKTSDGNPLGLYPAYDLYKRDAYRHLVERFGLPNVYILSAGWGLIPAGFLTPYYDITFSAGVEPYKKRLKTDVYFDLQMLPNDSEDQVVFIGGKDYLPLFCKLTARLRSIPIVLYNSVNAPRINHCKLRRFETTTRTNWHYECANALIDGSIVI